MPPPLSTSPSAYLSPGRRPLSASPSPHPLPNFTSSPSLRSTLPTFPSSPFRRSACRCSLWPMRLQARRGGTRCWQPSSGELRLLARPRAGGCILGVPHRAAAVVDGSRGAGVKADLTPPHPLQTTIQSDERVVPKDHEDGRHAFNGFLSKDVMQTAITTMLQAAMPMQVKDWMHQEASHYRSASK